LHPIVKRTPVDPMLVWTKSREFPNLAKKSFHEQWAAEQKKGAQ